MQLQLTTTKGQELLFVGSTLLICIQCHITVCSPYLWEVW